MQRLRQPSPSTLEQPSKVTTAPSVWSLSLEELVTTGNSTASQCDRRLTFMEDKIVPHAWQRKIPYIIHVTGKTRCLSHTFMVNLNKWKLENHSFYFHDEDAMDRLLNENWPEFPQLKMMQNCMVSGAAKADLWRYLVLYRYGGIYTGKFILDHFDLTIHASKWNYNSSMVLIVFM
jgi:mannosyltransferase OCH1-like enzyme